MLCCAAGPCCATDRWRAREFDHRGREGEGGAKVRRAALKEEQRAAAAGDGGSRGGAAPWASASAPVAGERVAEVAGGEGRRMPRTVVFQFVREARTVHLPARFEGCNRGLSNSVVHTQSNSTTWCKDIGEHDAERRRLSQAGFWLGDIELHMQ